jgi:hypothetical protein
LPGRSGEILKASDRSVARRTGSDNKTVAGVRRRLESGEEIPHLNERNGSDGKRYPSARKPIVMTTSNAQAIEAQVLLGELGDEVPDGPVSIKKLRRIKSARERAEHLDRVSRTPPGSGGRIKIHHGDFRHLAGETSPGSVDLALCDPPWGNEFADQRRAFAEALFRLLKPDGILACYTGVAHLPEFLDAFRQAGLIYEWTIARTRPYISPSNRSPSRF